jgi:hypothetical protein
METTDGHSWTAGMITWVFSKGEVLLDDFAYDLLQLSGTPAHELTIDSFLSLVVEEDRGHVERELYSSISRGGHYAQEFNISVSGSLRRIALKGRAVKDLVLTCMIEPIDVPSRPGRLLELCLEAYEVARQENNDAAAMRLIGVFNLIRPVVSDRESPSVGSVH